jgi:hypothetical protein
MTCLAEGKKVINLSPFPPAKGASLFRLTNNRRRSHLVPQGGEEGSYAMAGKPTVFILFGQVTGGISKVCAPTSERRWRQGWGDDTRIHIRGGCTDRATRAVCISSPSVSSVYLSTRISPFLFHPGEKLDSRRRGK